MKAYIGADPGKSGGIAVIFERCFPPRVYEMPETEKDLWDIVHDCLHGNGFEYIAAIEKVSARPGQGVSSMFTFGKGYGALRMAFIAQQIPFRDVTPQAWQKEIGCLTGGDKNVSLVKAQQLFPAVNWSGTKKRRLAIADALLIAEWLRRQP